MTEPLRLALYTIEYPPQPFSSGIGTYTETLARRLVERGHVVHVVSRGTAQDRDGVRDGVHLHFVTPERPDVPDDLSGTTVAAMAGRVLVAELRYRWNVATTLRRVVADHDLHLVESAEHMAETSWYRTASVPFVVRLHTPLGFSETIDPAAPAIVRKLVGAMEGRLARRADRVSAPSSAAADAFADFLGVDRDRIDITPNPPSFDPPETTEIGATDPATLLFVGRLSRWKGAHLLAAGLPRIAEAVPDVRLVFVGADNPISGHRSVRDYLLELAGPARDRIEFTGRIEHEHLRTWYQRATVVALPSLFEAFGYTCLEAMGFGKAIIGSANGGMRDLLDDGRAGILLEGPDVQRLADHAVELLRDPDLRRRYGAAALERARTRYHPERMIDEIESYYRSLVDAHAP